MNLQPYSPPTPSIVVNGRESASSQACEVLSLQSSIIVVSACGLLNKAGDVDWSMLHDGLETGDSWVPGETNTSIRPAWFFHDAENKHVKR